MNGTFPSGLITNIVERFSREGCQTIRKRVGEFNAVTPNLMRSKTIILKVLVFICFVTLSFSSYADDITVFKEYAQRADSAYAHGNIKLCFRINEDIIAHFRDVL